MSTAPPAPRNRLGTITLVVVALGALLAVFPATAPLGLLLCLAALLPAIIGFVRVRRGRAGHPRRSTAALVLAPVFLVVAAIVTSTLPRPAPAVDPAPAAVNAAVAAPARSTTTAAVPTTEPVPALVAPAAAPVAPAAAPVAPAAVAAPIQQQVPVAPARAIPAPRAAPQPAPAPLKKAAPAPVAAPVPAKAPAPKTSAPKAAAPKAPAPAPTTPAKAPAASCDSADHYVNSSGNCVPRPVQAATAPSGASAKCKDGTYSFSQHRSGTCSGHSGVAQWLKDLP
jgi:outer membrane biosynthesis protein TonB